MPTTPKHRKQSVPSDDESRSGTERERSRSKTSRSEPLTKITDEEWQELARRAEILRPLLRPKPLTAAMVANACDELELRKSQFYALLAKFKADPRVTSLLPAQRGPRKGECRIAPEICALIDANIEHRFLTRQKLTVAALYGELQHDCQKAGLPVPSERTVRRRIAAVPPSLVVRTREGAAAARQRFTPLRGSLKTEYPLDVVQIDHTLMELMILDEVTRQSIGRVWLTVLLDVHTRVVCGFYISPEHPCTTSVALTIAHAVLPKGPWLRTNGINLPWPVEGLPRCIHVDNAREFHSKAMVRACQQHGIFLDFRPPGLPHFGGHMERLMGTLMKRTHELAGTTFSNIRERGDADPEASAVLTLSELQRVFALEVLGPYHHEVHSGIGMPPLAAWSERMAQRPHPPALPHDPNEFVHSFLPFKEVTVRREGIRLHSIFYNDDILATFIGQNTGKLRAKYDPRDLSLVYLEDPTGRHWPIGYSDVSRPAITLWEHRAAVKAKRELGLGKVDENAIFEAVAARRAIVIEAEGRTRTARRERQRTAHLTTNGRGRGSPGAPVEASSETPVTIHGSDEALVPMPRATDRSGGSQWISVGHNAAAIAPTGTSDDAQVPMPRTINPRIGG